MKKTFALILFVAFCASAQGAAEDISAVEDTSIVNIEQKNLLLSVVSWPFVNIIQPSVEFLIYPAIPPLLYMSRENLVEKGENLVTFGEKRQIMFYPTANAKVGSQASLGFAYWHSNVFLEDDRIHISPNLFVNADWSISVRYRKNKILGGPFYWGAGASYRADGDNWYRDMHGVRHSYSDSSIYTNSFSGFNFTGNWSLELDVALNFYRFDLPNLYEEPITDEVAFNRGYYRNYEAYPLTFSLLHNSLDVPYAATRGRKFSVSYSYVPVSRYNGTSDHNYHVVASRLVNYNLLGNRSYAMTVAESNANRERLKNLTFAEAIEMFNPINVREEVLDRRVLITQLKMRYMVEENEGKAPFTAMSKLGGNFPLRAYDDGFFTAPLVVGVSNEYRWPIDRYADALIFNEYGIYGENFGNLRLSNIKNSYGIGFRVRTPRFFVARFSLAFHGLHGITVILTTNPEFH
ncbi:MAG: hypothetical protein LBU89_00115 [Fibromonadaceae bacterium]|jgi:outer membrane protein assembly factor BamA|nr:hypothetical protein [Fibromonadaceae bacterium]